MDTRYWGPSGWKLLHLVAADKKVHPAFWSVLPYVLPCKFCRTSLSEYYEKKPLNQSDLQKWLWTIHNMVNAKLRKQGQIIEDPPFSSIENYYSKQLQMPCSKVTFPGWEFLFSIADNHPDKIPFNPLEGYDTKVHKTLSERNKWNALSCDERKRMLLKFWKILPSVFPYQEWRDSWKEYAGPVELAIESRQSALKWLWIIRKGMDSDLYKMKRTSFYGLCREIATKRSGCATSKRARTCRKKTMKKKHD